MSRAIADAVALAVERRQRHQHDIGNEFCGRRRRLEDAERPQHQPVVGRPGAKRQRFSARQHRRQRQLRALLGELAHQGRRIDLAADRRIARHDHAGLDRKRHAALGHRLRRGSALLVAQRIALCQRGGAEVGFRQGCRHAGSCPLSSPALCAIAQLERVIQYSRDFSDSTETPRRTGYPAFAGYDGTCAGKTKSQATKTKVRSRERR